MCIDGRVPACRKSSLFRVEHSCQWLWNFIPSLQNVCISHLHIIHSMLTIMSSTRNCFHRLLSKRPCTHQCRWCGLKAARENVSARWRTESYFWADLSCCDKKAETWTYLSWIFIQSSLLSSGICIILVHLLIKFKLHFLPESVAVVSLGKFPSCEHADVHRLPWCPPPLV